GFTIPDGGSGGTMAVLTTGGLSGASIPMTSLSFETQTAPSVSGHTFQSVKSIGGAYGFNGVPAGAAPSTYATNLLYPNYPTPGDVPGVFIDTAGTSANQFTMYIALRSATDGRVLLFGATVDNVFGTLEIAGTSIYVEN